ncbi:dienelactone hydrolase family protein [Hydrogenophaga sp.]|uniref:dienelactone hydrolase family protein n=1 Tax=Hydrogenophaga sp. TaxID=1904254 RepID=UPI00272B5A54|nr:dienelactone hydrolase family protein [Hydrogenophaga sp.]
MNDLKHTSGLAEHARPRRLPLWLGKLILGVLLAHSAQASERVTFEATQGHSANKISLRAELSRPEGDGPFPAVVLMHGCGGWQAPVRYTMNRYAEHLVSKGFVVLNLDSFGPRNQGGGKVCESFDRLADARDYRTYDAHDALRYLQAQPFVDRGSVFLMGQSNGGSVAIKVAKGDGPHGQAGATDGFRGVVAFYPWCGAFERRSVQLKTPLLVFGGGQDDWVPASECEGVRSTGADLQLIVYPEAAHSFDLDIVLQRYLGKLVGRNAQAADDSRDRMLAFFVGLSRHPGSEDTRVAQK